MYVKRFFFCAVSLIRQTRGYAADPFPGKVSRYLQRAQLIDSIRLKLRSDPPSSLASVLNVASLDSFVVTNALRSAPSADSALCLFQTLKSIPHFSHTQATVSAMTKVLARSQRIGELKNLISDVKDGEFGNVCVSDKDLIRLYATAGDLESALCAWEEYRSSNKGITTDTYNIGMEVCTRLGRDSEAVQLFSQMIDDGAVPNSRTYTVMIEHLVNSSKIDSALEIFHILPSMRIKPTLKQYSVLVEGFIGLERFEEVKTLLHEMKVEGVLPGRVMCLSLLRMREAGYVQETNEFLKETLPDERIKNVGFCVDGSDDDEDEDEDITHASCGGNVDKVQLKPWLDPRALATALRDWRPDEVSALEDAKFVWTTRLVCKILREFRSTKHAWDFFCWVARQQGFAHDIYTIQKMIALLARCGHVKSVDELIAKIRREGMRLPFSTIRLIIDLYGISKKPDAALKVFRNERELCGPISKFNLMLLYSSLLRTLTKCKRNAEAMDVLEEMILCEVYPNIQTFSGLIHHFAVEGDIEKAQEVYAMIRQSGVEPDAYVFKVLIQAYCKCGKAASLGWRVYEDLSSSNLKPDAATKELLVKALWTEGKRRKSAVVQGSCEETSDALPLVQRGHLWTVSSSTLSRVYDIYLNSFTSTKG